jgi:hypothetical protein
MSADDREAQMDQDSGPPGQSTPCSESNLPQPGLSGLGQALQQVRRLLREQQSATTSRDVYAALQLAIEAIEVACFISISAELGDNHDQAATLVAKTRASLHQVTKLGDFVLLLDAILKTYAPEYNATDSDAARKDIRVRVSTHLRVCLGPPKRTPGSAHIPGSPVPASGWHQLIDLGLKAALVKGRPLASTKKLPPKHHITYAILSAWGMQAATLDAQAHVAKPSSRRSR